LKWRCSMCNWGHRGVPITSTLDDENGPADSFWWSHLTMIVLVKYLLACLLACCSFTWNGWLWHCGSKP
jgi:hypothetical protein